MPAQLGWGFSTRRPRARFVPVTPALLTDDEAQTFSEVAFVVNDRYEAALDVATRRTLSAIRERSDAQDALIDAVIAWESLFGHGGLTEVIFRVTTALAILMQPDKKLRLDLVRDLKRVYAVRSRVVHGSEIRTKDKLEERKELAISTAILALRTLLLDRPDLISNQDRGMELIVCG